MADDHVHLRLESKDFECDDLQVFELSGREALGQLFSLRIGAATTRAAELDLSMVEGATATLVFEVKGLEIRRVHGMIAQIEEQLDTEPETRSYQLSLVPRAYRLSLVKTQEIFMDLSIPEIIQYKLSLVGFLPEDTEMRLFKEYPKLEYVVQYKETDLDFISRLAENAGITFFFDHEGVADKWIFSDNNGAFHPAPGHEVVHFRPRGERRDVYRVEATTRLVPRMHVVHDYNYRNALLDPMGNAEAPSGLFGGIVEYGAHVKTPDDAKALAKIRAEEAEARHRVYSLESDLSFITAARQFELTGHPKLGDVSLIVTEATHAGRFPIALFGGKEHATYTCAFRAIESAIVYRPARVTPRPTIHGVISGVIAHEVEGTESKFARLDEYGRYLVRMMFDTAETGDRRVVSRRIRMAQPHAGPDYGHHFPLKPGVEVLVGFIDGDPDRPIILGAISNSITPSPVADRAAPAHRIKTATGILIELKDA